MRLLAALALLLAAAAPAHAQGGRRETMNRIMQRLNREFPQLLREMAEHAIRTAKEEIAKAGPIAPPSTFEGQVDLIARQIANDDGINGRLRKVLLTPEGKRLVKDVLDQFNLEKIEEGIEMFFDRGKDGKLRVKDEFADQVLVVLESLEKKPPPAPSPTPAPKPAPTPAPSPLPTPAPVPTGKPFLGIEIGDMTAEDREAAGLKGNAGIKIAGVVMEGPADKAGVKPGDVLVELAGKEVALETFADQMDRIKPGEVVEVTVYRTGGRLKYKITAAERPR